MLAGRAPRPAFQYWDRGTMATIGRSAAVAWIGRLHFSGLLAWLASAGAMTVADRTGMQLLPAAFFIPFFGCVLAQMYRVRCPRCNGNLGQLMARTLAPGPLRTTVRCCPFCGTDFNEQI